MCIDRIARRIDKQKRSLACLPGCLPGSLKTLLSVSGKVTLAETAIDDDAKRVLLRTKTVATSTSTGREVLPMRKMCGPFCLALESLPVLVLVATVFVLVRVLVATSTSTFFGISLPEESFLLAQNICIVPPDPPFSHRSPRVGRLQPCTGRLCRGTMKEKTDGGGGDAVCLPLLCQHKSLTRFLFFRA